MYSGVGSSKRRVNAKLESLTSFCSQMFRANVQDVQRRASLHCLKGSWQTFSLPLVFTVLPFSSHLLCFVLSSLVSAETALIPSSSSGNKRRSIFAVALHTHTHEARKESLMRKSIHHANDYFPRHILMHSLSHQRFCRMFIL